MRGTGYSSYPHAGGAYRGGYYAAPDPYAAGAATDAYYRVATTAVATNPYGVATVAAPSTGYYTATYATAPVPTPHSHAHHHYGARGHNHHYHHHPAVPRSAQQHHHQHAAASSFHVSSTVPTDAGGKKVVPVIVRDMLQCRVYQHAILDSAASRSAGTQPGTRFLELHVDTCAAEMQQILRLIGREAGAFSVLDVCTSYPTSFAVFAAGSGENAAPADTLRHQEDQVVRLSSDAKAFVERTLPVHLRSRQAVASVVDTYQVIRTLYGDAPPGLGPATAPSSAATSGIPGATSVSKPGTFGVQAIAAIAKPCASASFSDPNPFAADVLACRILQKSVFRRTACVPRQELDAEEWQAIREAAHKNRPVDVEQRMEECAAAAVAVLAGRAGAPAGAGEGRIIFAANGTLSLTDAGVATAKMLLPQNMRHRDHMYSLEATINYLKHGLAPGPPEHYHPDSKGSVVDPLLGGIASAAASAEKKSCSVLEVLMLALALRLERGGGGGGSGISPSSPSEHGGGFKALLERLGPQIPDVAVPYATGAEVVEAARKLGWVEAAAPAADGATEAGSDGFAAFTHKGMHRIAETFGVNWREIHTTIRIPEIVAALREEQGYIITPHPQLISRGSSPSTSMTTHPLSSGLAAANAGSLLPPPPASRAPPMSSTGRAPTLTPAARVTEMDVLLLKMHQFTLISAQLSNGVAAANEVLANMRATLARTGAVPNLHVPGALEGVASVSVEEVRRRGSVIARYFFDKGFALCSGRRHTVSVGGAQQQQQTFFFVKPSPEGEDHLYGIFGADCFANESFRRCDIVQLVQLLRGAGVTVVRAEDMYDASNHNGDPAAAALAGQHAAEELAAALRGKNKEYLAELDEVCMQREADERIITTLRREATELRQQLEAAKLQAAKAQAENKSLIVAQQQNQQSSKNNALSAAQVEELERLRADNARLRQSLAVEEEESARWLKRLAQRDAEVRDLRERLGGSGISTDSGARSNATVAAAAADEDESYAAVRAAAIAARALEDDEEEEAVPATAKRQHRKKLLGGGAGSAGRHA